MARRGRAERTMAKGLSPKYQQAIERAARDYSEGRTKDAAAACRKILRKIPREANALRLLGAIHLREGETGDAIEMLTRAAKADARNAEIHKNLGIAHQAAGDHGQAARSFKTALAANAGLSDIRMRLVAIAFSAERHEEVLALCKDGLEANPHDAALHNARGAALIATGDVDGAFAAFREALTLNPTLSDAHVNFGNALADSYAAEDAIPHFEKALALAPPDAEILANYGHALRQLDRFDDAVALYDRAVVLDPGGVEPNFGNAVMHLTHARYGRGWRYYLGRNSMRLAEPSLCRERPADDLSGSRILILPDQGIGDENFFLRFAPDLKARGARLMYRPDPRLAGMLTRAGVAETILGTDDAAGPCDLTVSVGDLPFLLAMADNDAPPPPFAIPPLDDSHDRMKARLEALGPPPYLAVTWRAGAKGRRRLLDKEAPLAGIARAMRATTGTLVALQRNPNPGEIDAFADAAGRQIHDLTDLNETLEDMLALVGLLDDYICVSNSNVHLRAATGRPCRVLVPSPPEFRWMAAGDESPWFPGTRVYRQHADGDWDQALAALANDMKV